MIEVLLDPVFKFVNFTIAQISGLLASVPEPLPRVSKI